MGSLTHKAVSGVGIEVAKVRNLNETSLPQERDLKLRRAWRVILFHVTRLKWEFRRWWHEKVVTSIG
jgi:hypothetical protein